MKPYTFKLGLRQITCAILIVFLLFGQTSYASTVATDEENLKYLQGVMDMILDQYKGEVTSKQLVEAAVEGMLESLDDYTTYFTQEEADSFLGTISGTFGGVGIVMEKSDDYIIVSKVFSASPAEKAGILQGDKIVEADGKSLVKATTDEAASVIRGEEGTIVKLGIVRKGTTDVKYMDVIREVIRVNPVSYEIRDKIGYIKLEMFNENTGYFFKQALAEMDKKKITKLVLDLRDNPGGEVSAAAAVAQELVPKGLITKLDYKSETYKDIEYYSYLEKPKYNLAVLVNGMSASASEIVSGAIQDTGAGKLVGTKTFGKAKFQGMLPILTPQAFSKYKKLYGVKTVNAFDPELYGIHLYDDEIAGYTKMTLGRYYTPKGRMIDGTGLTPDIEVEDTELVSGIDINTIERLTMTTSPGLNDHGADVYNAEKLLKVMRYRVRTIDNTLDAMTSTAIKAYQKASGLEMNGILDYNTQEALNASLLEQIIKYDKQYNAAVELLQ